MYDKPNTAGRLVIVRSFKAPRQMVFDAFADPKALAIWWGPKDSPITVEKMEFKPGGMFLYSLDMMENKVFGRFLYQRIESPSIIEFVFSFANEKGEPVRAFFSADWPLEVFNRAEFTEANGITTVTFSGQPVNSNQEELAMYQSMVANMEQGFGNTFNQLEVYLSNKQAK